MALGIMKQRCLKLEKIILKILNDQELTNDENELIEKLKQKEE